ncbi:DNA-binding transcriptional LysR family regulator [Pseudomonas duriflava]|uniref:DNA-binding transcriptional LysR family regulator n=1 Tax=Pseudomonas duriflava TaxID=459528 RepID=A0A562Q6X3_9PSED|nr:LysR family transcriptional regulator [Pseudomonas duriflava]TWI52511.1 DNA-binding transcriptional LysR family regulator [Pseudomonas duriflava]
MDLYQAMTIFVRVVDSGSMTAAAEQSGISTTMVGNYLRSLEARLGVSLLRRTTRRQSLTEFGAMYYQRCVEILGLVTDSERLAEEMQAQPRGTLRITAPPTFGSECLMPSLADYLSRYAAVKLDIVLTDRVVDLVDEGFDAAIRLGTLETSSLIARPLMDYGLTICASPAYLERKGQPLKPHDLSQHDCLSFAYPAGTEWRWTERHWRLTGSEGEVAVEVGGRVVVNNAQGLRRAALGGMGVAMLPNALVWQDLEQGGLVTLLPDYQLPSRPMHVVYPQERYRSPTLRSFVEFVVQTFGQVRVA